MARSLLCPWTALLTVHLALGCGCAVSTPSADASTPGHLLCAVTLQADDALAPVVEAAAVRWGAAMACDISLGDSGPLFELAASIERPNGTQAPGMTNEGRDHVLIHSRMTESATESAVMHELGHVLGGEHTDTMAVLSGHAGHSSLIDRAALDTVCVKRPCGELSPEVP